MNGNLGQVLESPEFRALALETQLFISFDEQDRTRKICSSMVTHEAVDVSCRANRPDRREDRDLRRDARLEHNDGTPPVADRFGLSAAVPSLARGRLVLAAE